MDRGVHLRRKPLSGFPGGGFMPSFICSAFVFLVKAEKPRSGFSAKEFWGFRGLRHDMRGLIIARDGMGRGQNGSGRKPSLNREYDAALQRNTKAYVKLNGVSKFDPDDVCARMYAREAERHMGDPKSPGNPG
jgi:hypothetical protein